MFNGTGAFQKFLCPYTKKPSGNSLEIITNCDRPHCKYSHSVENFAETQNGISQQAVAAKRPSNAAESNISLNKINEDIPDILPTTSAQAVAEDEEAVRNVDDSISVVAPLSSTDASLDLPQLESSIQALHKSGITPLLLSTLNADNLKPTYSESTSQSSSNDQNPYNTPWDEPLINDLEYDPVRNWKMPFRPSIPEETVPHEPATDVKPEISAPQEISPQSSSTVPQK